jgi:hypothetical protein
MPTAREQRQPLSVGVVFAALTGVISAVLAVPAFLEANFSIFSILSYDQGEMGRIYKVVAVATVVFAFGFYIQYAKRSRHVFSKKLKIFIVVSLTLLVASMIYSIVLDSNYVIRYEFNGYVSDVFRPFTLAEARYPDMSTFSVIEQNKSLAQTLTQGMSMGEALDLRLRSDGWLVYTSYLVSATVMAFSLNMVLIVLAYFAAVGTSEMIARPASSE